MFSKMMEYRSEVSYRQMEAAIEIAREIKEEIRRGKHNASEIVQKKALDGRTSRTRIPDN